MPAPRSRSTLPILFSVVILDLIGFGIVVPVMPFFAKHFDASGLQLGLIVASYSAMQFVFAPVWGRLSDRIGRRPVMLITIAGSSIGLLVLGLAESLPMLYAGRILGGAFAANVSVASAYVTDVTEESERTRYMGMIGASFGVGFLLGPALGGLLAPYGYGVPMLVAAGMAAANFVWAAVSLTEPPSHGASQEERGELVAVLRNPLVRRLCLLNLVFSAAVTQLETVFAYFMNERFDYEVRDVAWLLVFMATIMAAIQGGAIRPIAARFGERAMLLGGWALLAVCFVAVPIMPTVAILLVPLALSSVGRGIAQPALMSMVSVAASAAERGAVMGSFQSAASLARVFGPPVAGLLWDYGYATPFWLAAALMVLGIALAIGLPRDAAPKPAVA